jgi:shikimate dehydrogenase
VLVLGAGGAARAALAALLTLPGVERVLVAARREEQAAALLASLPPPENEAGERKIPKRECLPWQRREQARADLIVNATPLGLDNRQSPLRLFSGHGLAYDLIHRDTPFLRAARAAGWNTLNGRDMFIQQASAQFILWTGFPLPETAISAVDQAISSPPPSNP